MSLCLSVRLALSHSHRSQHFFLGLPFLCSWRLLVGVGVFTPSAKMAAQASALSAPMLGQSPNASPKLTLDGRIAYTIDHSEHQILQAPVHCTRGQVWLAVFVVSGVLTSMTYELLHLHAGPAEQESFLLVFFCYVAQLIMGGTWLLVHGSWRRRGVWTRPMAGALLLSSIVNGFAQALDYIALNQSGVQLYTILHGMTTIFACAIAVGVLQTHISAAQWVAVVVIVVGLVLTGVPTPVDSQGNFVVAFFSGAAGALCLAASYPLAELVFTLCPRGTAPPSEEACSVAGSLINVFAFGAWTLSYTVPQWDKLVLAPARDAPFPASAPVVVLLYMTFALMVGMHTLAFWKSMPQMGTVTIAVSKGAQHAITFLFAHILFCHDAALDDSHVFHGDAHQCITSSTHHGPNGTVLEGTAWSKAQKPASFVVCSLGCQLYAFVNKKKRPSVGTAVPAPVAEDAN